MKNNYSMQIADKINGFLSSDDWDYTFDENKGIFRFGLHLNSNLKTLTYIVKVKKDSFLVYGILPIGVEIENKDMMHTMAEFICRCNFGLINGNFEFDFRDGEIRYKSFVDCEAIKPSDEIIRNSIHCVAIMVERYSRGILDIIFSGVPANVAIERCEKESLDFLLGVSSNSNDGLSGTQGLLEDTLEDCNFTDDLFNEGDEN